jgi:nitrite reductase/ring-hydroxylating ferredoxin subunit
MALVTVAASQDLPQGARLRREAGGRPLLLARLPEGLFAVDDRCPHRGASLAESELEGPAVTCRAHFWSFDVRSGACVQVPGLSLRTFRVF